MAPASEWMSDMNDNADVSNRIDDDMLDCVVSDEALEAAASIAAGAAMSFPGAPTVNVLVMCCGNNVDARPRD